MIVYILLPLQGKQGPAGLPGKAVSITFTTQLHVNIHRHQVCLNMSLMITSPPYFILFY